MDASTAQPARTTFAVVTALLALALTAVLPAIPSRAATGGPDAAGYSFVDSDGPGGPAFNFEDISATGTPLGGCDDCVQGPFPLGFAFNYYGASVSSIFVSSNGFLTALAGQYHGCCVGRPIPSTSSPNGVIAGWWNDLFPASGEMRYQTLGASPNRRFIAQWTNVRYYGSTTPRVTFQIKLFEGSNDIEAHYRSIQHRGVQDSSAGIENQTGTVGLQYFIGSSGFSTPRAVRYSLNHAPDCSRAASSRTALWPANHQFEAMSVVGVTDPDPGDVVAIAVAKISQDEPVRDTGDGAFAPDGRILGPNSFELRAERAGGGNGRVYVVGFTATDSRGASCRGLIEVSVPRDQGRNTVTVNDGATYDSTVTSP